MTQIIIVGLIVGLAAFAIFGWREIVWVVPGFALVTIMLMGAGWL